MKKHYVNPIHLWEATTQGDTPVYLAAEVDARIAELRQAFNRYGRHTDPCLDSGHRACICGYVDAYKSLMDT